MSQLINYVFCPIKNGNIDICECFDIQNVADNAVAETVIDFSLSENDKRTCKLCKKRVDLS